jgi:hypothetical protein
MDFHADHSAYLERKFQESSVDSQSQDSVDTDGMEIDSLPDTPETINQIGVITESVTPTKIASVDSGPIDSKETLIGSENNSLSDKQSDNHENDKQKCLQLLLGHMERSAQSHYDIMQGLLQKLF